MDSRTIFQQLQTSEPSRLSDLPESFGLYALWDHTTKIRYIGCTPKATEGFRTRIFNKHSTGSEGRSHKFSQAYCTGRMWRYCKKLHPLSSFLEQDTADADAAKKLRNAFIRKFCKATYVEIPTQDAPSSYFSYLTSLEAEIQSMAPASMRTWERIGFASLSEPSDLVDQLLIEFPTTKSTVEKQNTIYMRHVHGAVAV